MKSGGRDAVIASEGFASFVCLSGRLVERALSQVGGFDILQSYTSDGPGSRRVSSSQILSETLSFEYDYLKGRPVMDIQVSPHTDTQAALFLVAYGAVNQARRSPSHDSKPTLTVYSLMSQAALSSASSSMNGGGSGNYSYMEGSGDGAAGLVCIWHSGVTSSPEKKLTAPSPVLAAQFHTEDQNLVIGSCYNGQVVMWDLRNSSSLPVQRSNLSGKGHKHPVYSIAMSSSSASYELITVSTDGHLCHWDIQRLSEPISSVSLQLSGPPLADANAASVFNTLSVTSTVLSNSDSAGYEAIFGSENGKLYRIAMPYRAFDAISQVKAHQGLISSMHRNPGGGKFFRDLLLTSSLDWTVKLWNTSAGHFEEPLLELLAPTYDYVCDVKWSPLNASLFSTITSAGVVTVWDISKSITEPQDSLNILTDTGASSSTGPTYALNKSVWSCDGCSIYVGDTKGCKCWTPASGFFVEPILGVF